MAKAKKKTSKSTTTRKRATKKSTSASSKRPRRTAKKKVAKKRPTTSSEDADKVRKAFLKDGRQLLEALFEPNHNAYKAAQKQIDRLIVSADAPVEDEADQLLLLVCLALSSRHLPGYATLDAEHLKHIDRLIDGIEKYVDDKSQKRPLNYLMLASPGAGKSHFIKCVAKRLARKNISAITFNMASLQTNEDLVPPLDAARNLKVDDRLPLLFLDEFDSSPTNYALLLPLLWDGELNIGQRDLKLGKVVIVLAGSDPSIPELMDHARGMRFDVPIADSQSPKIVDLFSRINGGELRIPTFLDASKKVDRRADKVCIAVHLLRHRFGPSLRTVPAALLRFIARVNFRYGVRSIAHLIDLIPFADKMTDLVSADLGLPVDDHATLKQSSLAYHLYHDDQAYGVVQTWQAVWAADDSNIPIRTQELEYLPPPSSFARFGEDFLQYMSSQMLFGLRNES